MIAEHDGPSADGAARMLSGRPGPVKVRAIWCHLRCVGRWRQRGGQAGPGWLCALRHGCAAAVALVWEPLQGAPYAWPGAQAPGSRGMEGGAPERGGIDAAPTYGAPFRGSAPGVRPSPGACAPGHRYAARLRRAQRPARWLWRLLVRPCPVGMVVPRAASAAASRVGGEDASATHLGGGSTAVLGRGAGVSLRVGRGQPAPWPEARPPFSGKR